MIVGSRIAHFNIARLRHPPGDPRVAEFVDNSKRVNEVATRSKGYVWHLTDGEALVTNPEYKGPSGDPRLAFSMSVWESREDFSAFVYKTVHSSFFKRRAEWFEPWSGPNYVMWDFAGEPPIMLEEGWKRLGQLADNGPSASAYDLLFDKALG